MNKNHRLFLQEAEKVAFDKQHRKTIQFNMAKYDAAVDAGKQKYAGIEEAKEYAAAIKNDVIEHLGEYLIEFEKNARNNGIEVIWAKDSKQALEAVIKICRQNDAKQIVKSKSMTTEEIGLNEGLEHQDIESLETDLGEFIVQVAGEKPYHIVTPAMHKSKEDIDALFHEKFKTPQNSSPEELTLFVRKLLREKFVNANIGITGANFLVADSGSVVVTENEGNAIMSTAFPGVHIAIAGIEKVIPTFEQLGIMLPLLAMHGTGQQISAYNTIFSGAKQTDETSGPQSMYVILLDNGRSDLLARTLQSEALKCIRCGACLNACPVYRNIGGYTYSTTYSGPIGSVISPHFEGFTNFGHLSFASSLCGKCNEVCPVKIDLRKLLLFNRKHHVVKKKREWAEKCILFGYQKIMLNRRLFDIGSQKIRNFAVQTFGKEVWGPRRDLPVVKKSFAKLYRKLKKTKNL